MRPLFGGISFVVAIGLARILLASPVGECQQICENLRVLNKDLQNNSISAEAGAGILIGQLKALRAQDRPINALNAAISDADRRYFADRYRGAAWLNGWSAFSRLAVSRAATAYPSQVRSTMLDMQRDTGALALLVSIYNDMCRGNEGLQRPLNERLVNLKRYIQSLPDSDEGKAAAIAKAEQLRAWIDEDARLVEQRIGIDPLRIRLRDEVGIEELLSYRVAWPTPDSRGSIVHDFYLPPAAALIGEFNQAPFLSQDLLSLWSLLNLELDTWHNLEDENASLSQLSAFVDALAANDDLSAFNRGPAAESLRADMAVHRMRKIGAFLRFRSSVAKTGALDSLLEGIYKSRTLGDPSLKSILPDLIDAATPLAANERLPDAEIWLRYLLLLSHQRDPSAAVDIANTELWQDKWMLPGKFVIDPPLQVPTSPSVTGRCAFLRWNTWPVAGHSSLVLADTTSAVFSHLQFERTVDSAESAKERFAVLNQPAGAKTYAVRLRAALDGLGKTIDVHLAPYFADNRRLASLQVTQHNRSAATLDWSAEPVAEVAILAGMVQSWPDDSRSRLRAQALRREPPFLLTHPASSSSTAWTRTNTRYEQTKLNNDLTDITALVVSTRHLHALMARGLELGDPALISQAFGSLSGASTDGHWTMQALPQKTFSQYDSDLQLALGILANELAANDKRVAEDELRFRYAQQLTIYGKAQKELAVAALGNTIATKALEISANFRKIADLDTQIATLRQQAAKAILNARDNTQKAAGLKLAYAARQRDLAEARLEALMSACDQAQAMVDQAAHSLEDLSGQLKAAAQTIEDQKKKSGIFKIIKAAIYVVGAALAPFTGGATLAAAAIINQAVDIAQTIDSTDWSNLASAANGLQNVATGIGHVVDSAVGRFGSAEMKSALAGYKAFLTSTEKKFSDFKTSVQKIGDEVSRLNDALKSLDPQHLAPIIAQLAAGAPISYSNGNISIDLSSVRKVTFSDPTIQHELSIILNCGGALFNDLAARRKELDALLQSEDVMAVRQELQKYFDQVVKQCPDDVVSAFNANIGKAKDDFGQAKQRLVNHIGEVTDIQKLRALAQVLAGGMVVVNVNGVVMAVERQVSEEAQRFQQRLTAFRQSIVQSQLGEVVASINSKRSALIAQAQQFSSKEDSDGLRQLAANDVPRTIDSIREEMDKIKAKITEARGQLEDADELKHVAEYDLAAADSFLAAAQVEISVAETNALRAQLGVEISNLALERDQLGAQLAEGQVDVQTLNLQHAEAELEHLYLQCIAMGFNPSVKASPSSELGGVDWGQPHDRLMRVARAVPADSSNLAGNLQIKELVSNLVGMIQWAQLLNDATATQACSDALQSIAITSSPTVTLDAKRDTLSRHANLLKQSYGGRAPLLTSIDVAQFVLGPKPFKMQWFESTKRNQQQVSPEQLVAEDAYLRQLPNESQLRAVCVMEFSTLSEKPGAIKDSLGVPIGVPFDAQDYIVEASYARRYFLRGREVLQMTTTEDFGTLALSFVLVPASFPTGTAKLTIKNNNHSPQPTEFKASSVSLPGGTATTIAQQVKQEFATRQEFMMVPAVGTWRVYVFSARINSPADRQAVVETCKGPAHPLTLELYMPFLEVSSPSRN